MRRKTQITSSYLNRKTFADHIADNFAQYNRRGYYQRILFCGRHKVAPNIVKERIMECVLKTNENLTVEFLTGVCLYYVNYSIYMVEALEDVIGSFMEHIVLIKDEIFDVSPILVIINNVQKVLFPSFVFRTADPPTVLEKITAEDDDSYYMEQGKLIDQFLNFCCEVSAQIEAEEIDVDHEFMSAEHTRLLISIQRIEFVLTMEDLFDLSFFLKSFRKIPFLEDFDSKVWPIPYDYTPNDVFRREKYDVNLTFPDNEKKN